MSKTILWLYNHPLNSEAGGTERVTGLLIKGLTQAGYNCMDVLVIDDVYSSFKYKNQDIEDVYAFLIRNNVDVVINQAGHCTQILDCFLEHGGQQWHKEGGRIISCLHFNPKPISVFYQFCSKQSKSLHDYYVLAKTFILHSYLAKKDRERVGRTYKDLYEKSDAFVILSEQFREYVLKAMKLNVAPKMHVVNNPNTYCDEAFDEREKENSILVVGRLLNWQKRIIVAIKAWEKLSNNSSFANWNFKIVGNGEDYIYYDSYIKQHKLERVSLEGQQTSLPYYRKSKILLLPSKTEGWPMVLLEAMQCGVVPIVFDVVPSFKEIVSNGKDGYIVPEGDEKEYMRRITYLVENPDVLQNMSNNAIKSSKRFELDSIIRQWIKIL